MLSADGSEHEPDAGSRLQVRVVHGNLAFARYPVAVGHYSGDTIVSAEKHLDRALNDALGQRLHLGLYPGPIETSAVFTNPRLARDRYARPGGAIVVGLGTVGTLTASLLTRSFSRALLEFVLERRKAPSAAPADDTPIGVATLLIGTGAGGISVTDSVYALVRAAYQANQALAAARQRDSIVELEVIELYEDRAILALESLARLSTSSGGEKMFTLREQLGKRDGGLQRVSYDDEAPEWWQRLQVLGAASGENGRSEGLRFSAVTRRARAEVRLLPTQRAIVDQFVQDTVATTQQNAGIGRTLFDLLLPNELKESAPNEDNVVLLLDEESARYPWELLEDSQDRNSRPFAVDRGLLRQLESESFRSVVRGSTELTALVIADPVSSFLELTGAQNEGNAVGKVLKDPFKSVKTFVRPTSQQVITALFEQPYKVLHLAGHGVYRYALPSERHCDKCGAELSAESPGGKKVPTITGMVIGDGVFLTPGDVAQMRSVPDLVFVNCCHLGNMDVSQGAVTEQEHAFPQLAANLATEFIRMGVRAVVAAGWAVEDDPATTFAMDFYQRMLRGETFGEAVKGARGTTYTKHQDSNTWGAYQCYGDPDFRLVLNQQQTTRDYKPTFLSPAHALRDLGNIAARLKTHSSSRRDEEIVRLDKIVEALDAKGWLRSGALRAALGRAFGEAGELKRAIDYYCAAMSSEDGAITAHDVEQCANLLGRSAVHQWSRNETDPAVTKQAVQDLRRAIYILKAVLGGRHGERLTSERLALIGSAYKRLAWLDREGRADSLAQMASYYQKGAQRAREQGLDSAYPLLNVRWAEMAMRWQGVPGAPALAVSLAQDLQMVRDELAKKEQLDGPQFWQDSLRVDCELLETVSADALSARRVDQLAGQYVSQREYASAREFASICDHLGFLAAMSEPIPGLAPMLAELRRLVSSSNGGQAQP